MPLQQLDGFSIHGFLSFGEEAQRIGPLSKVNIFIGPNNAGKSNILLYLRDFYSSVQANLKADTVFDIHPEFRNVHFTNGNLKAEFGLLKNSNLYKLIAEPHLENQNSSH